MGKSWDGWESPAAFQRWCLAWTRECLRVLKPGGHLVAFGGTRTYHRMVCAVEDAGFEIRDSLHWIYGSGFPKSLDVSKAIDKAAGAERAVVGDKLDRPGYHLHGHDSGTGALGRGISATTTETRLRAAQITAPATDDAARWSGWGTALKPAHEPIVLARKPLAGTVAANVLEHGTGALNVDGCRVGSGGQLRWAAPRGIGYTGGGTDAGAVAATVSEAGRWPANVLLGHDPDCADTCQPGCPVADMDTQSGVSSRKRSARGVGLTGSEVYGSGDLTFDTVRGHDDAGGASRFFPVFRYQAKAPAKERPRLDDGTAHPTVKPLSLMSWLVRLVTPPGGTVLEPFAGSGDTLEAAVAEGFHAVGIEREPAYVDLCIARLTKPTNQTLC
jgi:site-specific DNA-methyltransferase (adenine-specific)